MSEVTQNSEKSAVYLVLDTEFTGQHPERHGLIEAAFLALDKDYNEVAHYVTDICPPNGYQIDEAAMKVNKFEVSRIAQGISYKEFAKAMTAFVQEHFAKKPILVAHFVPMDFAYLNYVFESVGKGDEFWYQTIGYDIIDTKVLANLANAKARKEGKDLPFPSTSLSSPKGVRKVLGIEGHASHTALGDARATKEVFVKLLEFL
jgi:DNA polymerase III epsilon subunit-like protein